jgi:hypothetical protein
MRGAEPHLLWIDFFPCPNRNRKLEAGGEGDAVNQCDHNTRVGSQNLS